MLPSVYFSGKFNHLPMPESSSGAVASVDSQSPLSLLERMAALGRLAAKLTRSTDLDELCRNAIILGRQELGFDRLGLWFTSPEPDTIVGVYGTDETGALRNEHGMVMRLTDFPLGPAIYRKERYACELGMPIPSTTGELLPVGWKATAALWDGEEIIGYLFTDNLLQHRPYSDHDGELLALYALLLGHLCTRQRIEEALREREASYRAVMDAIPDYLFVLSRAGILLDYHAAKPALLEPSPATFIGASIDEFLKPSLAEQHRLAVALALQTGEPVTFEHSLPIGDTLYHFETRMTVTGNDKVVALMRDVTRRKRLEEQLYASQKLESMGRMASGVAHDFNNLLTVIQGFTSVAESQTADGTPKLRKALSHIRSASEKGARLTNQLLLFARKQVVQPRIVDVNTLLSGMKPMLVPLLGDTIELRLLLDAALGYVQIDPGQLEQVLINLAVNAADAMPNGGHFTVKTQNVQVSETGNYGRVTVPPGTYSLIEVSDTGVGIPPAIQKQIFEPFFTTKEHGKGTGLGLAICHSIIEQSGGHLRVYSIPNQGATFQIFLPPTTTALPTTATVTQTAPQNGNETILLVEDDDPVRTVAMEMLSSYGYTVLACSDGIEAMQKVKAYSQPIHLLMTDMVMPQLSGREVAEQFMQLRPGVPVLLVSGYTGELSDQLVSRPNVTFLPKPYTLPLLTKTVRTILDRHLRLH